ncbi:hypothetical protein [Streptomyces sp. 4R-3d]|uniref:hypothetical protein n=1 Tax=Streptomyces sp. 4R-3d TaxID=2559605 RepID=UPI001072C889|nr:hypothetical protein [Streptomyces sp. 4R-3d]TFI30088.1 hypothetical protein E4P36_04890 [Streptomyces sp. 4R-3d]
MSARPVPASDRVMSELRAVDGTHPAPCWFPHSPDCTCPATALSPEREQEIREQIIQALSISGAFCGECGFEPGDVGCSDCQRAHARYADAVMPILLAEMQRSNGNPIGGA